MVVGGERRQFAITISLMGLLLVLDIIQSMYHSRTRCLGRLSELIKPIDAIHRSQSQFVQFFLPTYLRFDRLQSIALLVIIRFFKLLPIFNLFNL